MKKCVFLKVLTCFSLIVLPGVFFTGELFSAQVPETAAEVISSTGDSMDDFVQEVRDEYDMVLFDCTPVLPTTDPAVLGRKTDGVVLVYAVGKVARGSLKVL